jgi:superoxide dismutase, Cu-Zn family
MKSRGFLCGMLGLGAVVFASVLTLFAAGGLREAIAVISPASGSSVKGVARFVQVEQGVKIVADIEGLAPNSKHGFHIHEFGDCSAPDATSAGSHYDPLVSKHHGMPTDKERHAGDMGNVQADDSGKLHYELVIAGVTIDGDQAPILGRGLIIHANPDDFTQPVGNAGGRVGCGVIGVAKPQN